MKHRHQGLNRLILGSLLIAMPGWFAACATTTTQSLKDQEYQELKTKVNEYHQASLYGADKPYLTDKPQGDWPDGRTLVAEFSQTYFAANPSAVNFKCKLEPLICGDPQTLEVLFRRLHNSAILSSRNEKLQRIEEWHQGNLTDEQLQTALHLEFKFVKGELIIRVPS